MHLLEDSAAVAARTTTVGILGSHGKSPTSAFCQAVLRASGAEGEQVREMPPTEGFGQLQVAVFTNLDPSASAYLAELVSLFGSLRYRSTGRPPHAVLNWNDATSRALLQSLRVPYITYGTSEESHIRAREIHSSKGGTTYLLDTPVGRAQIQLGLHGFEHVMHSLAAVAMGLALRIDLDTIVAAIESVSAAGQIRPSTPGLGYLVQLAA